VSVDIALLTAEQSASAFVLYFVLQAHMHHINEVAFFSITYTVVVAAAFYMCVRINIVNCWLLFYALPGVGMTCQ